MKIINLESVPSTNDFCKAQDGGEDLTVIARRQTFGRGTKGRTFISDEGGLYVSTMRHYENFPAENAFKIMINRCVAVCKTLEKFNIKPVVRWANDVLCGGLKISGTLIENTFSNGYIIRSIVGTGINVNNEISAEIKHIAVSMQEILKKKLNLKAVEREFCDNEKKEFLLEEYKNYIDWFGREVTLTTGDSKRRVKALDVTADGRLKVESEGKILLISSGEVSLQI